MKTHYNHYPIKLLILILLVTGSLTLASCAPFGLENTSENISKDQQGSNQSEGEQDNKIMIPVVGLEDENAESGTENKAYPDLDPEAQQTDPSVSPNNDAYPIIEEEMDAQPADEDIQEEPIQQVKPTPRGSELVATDPSTVNLASGKLQLVELFAFW